MPQFYKKRCITTKNTNTKYFITLETHTDRSIEIEVSKDQYVLLEEMQREHWRLERSESRHTHHLEMIPEWNLPKEAHVPSPEQMMIEHFENSVLCDALKQLPPVQLRRFLLKHYFELSSKQIAKIEGCSIRVIDRSILRAKEKLQQILKKGV